MTTVFSVIGSDHDDPDRLILIGDDGHHYQLELPQGTPMPIAPPDESEIDPIDATPDSAII